MKNILRISLVALAMLAASCSGIHEWPEEGKAVDPTEITATVKIKVKVGLSIGTIITKAPEAIDVTKETADKYDRRFIVTIRNAEFNEDEVGTWMITRPVEDTTALMIEPKLHARKYTIAVWMDYVLKGTEEDCWFYTGEGKMLSGIRVSEREKYIAGSDFKDGQHFLQAIDLTEHAGEWHIDITIDAPLQSRMAKVRFLASDLQKYAESIEWKESLDSLAKNMRVQFTYNGYFPTGFNAWTGRLNNSEIGYGFNHLCYNRNMFQEQAYTLVGSDWVLVNGESSSVNVSAIIRDKDGNYVNEVSNLQVPIERGKETVIIYKFFTKEYVPGIGINPDFDGEFNIYV